MRGANLPGSCIVSSISGGYMNELKGITAVDRMYCLIKWQFPWMSEPVRMLQSGDGV